RLRRERGLSVKDIQTFFGFEEPQAIYKWQRGKSLPSVDNLYALSALLDVSMDDIIVSRTILNRYNDEQQAAACCSAFLSSGCFGYGSVPVCCDHFCPAYTESVG
ncbi:MAG: helix-turn-helix transcriptional regulator, partial [Oscillospiraceae bacterium]|nr:helix-turn-helix transcriptional regulator [Oscillospiraceae bacterium]